MRLPLWAAPLAWMAVIFALSTDIGSTERTTRLLLPLLRWLVPGAAPDQLATLHGLLRKVGHVAEYAVLALLWCRAIRSSRTLGPRASAWTALAAALAWALLDEWHQSTLPSRTGSVSDVALDGAGAAAALLVLQVGWRAAVDGVATILLWTAALGGPVVLAVDWWAGVASGLLWLTTPTAALALLARRARRPPRVRPSDAGRACHASRPRTD